MKKAGLVVAGVAVAAVGVWTGASWYTGKRVEETVRQTVEQANAGNDWRATVEIVSYDRGWFTSSARYRVKGLGGPAAGDMLTLVVDSKVRHGPFPLDRLRGFQLAPVLATTESALARDEGFGTMLSTVEAGASFTERSVIHYDDRVDFRVETPAMSMAQDGGSLEIAGGSFVGNSMRDLSRLHVEGKLEAVRVKSPTAEQAAIEARNLTLSADNRTGRFGLQIGDAGLRIGSLTMGAATPAGAFSLVANDVAITSKVDEDERFLHAELDYNFGKVAVNGAELGGLDARFKVRQLDGAATARLTERYRALVGQANASGAETDEAMIEKMLAEMREPLDALLAGNPAFALDALTWSAPAGQSSLKIDVALRKRADASAEAAGRPGVGLQQANLDLVLSQPALIDAITRLSKTSPQARQVPDEQAREQATMVVAVLLSGVSQTGLVTSEGDNVESHIRYDGKDLQVNGEAVPPEALLELFPMLESGGEEEEE